jgi:hypothetical protein
VARRGIGGSLEDVEHVASTNLNRVGNQIGEQYDQATAGGTVLNPRAFLQTIADAKKSAYDVVQQGGKPKTIVRDKRGYRQYSAIEELVEDYGDTLTIPQGRALLETWDEVVKRSPGEFQNRNISDATEVAVKQRARTAMRDLLNQSVPNVEALNREYTFWARLEQVAKGSDLRQVGQMPGGLTRQMGRGAGLVAGAASAAASGDVMTAGVGAVVGAVAMESLNRILTSPQYRLLSASTKQRLADALAGGNEAVIKREIGRAAAAINALSAGSGNGSVVK